mmetsp:Transcript_27468/g.64403  ORF Transcript_27468/g.64403 Transcript_27468/m.64403 type:complete len:159 (+) Transcript_27468:690-1166(+)
MRESETKGDRKLNHHAYQQPSAVQIEWKTEEPVFEQGFASLPRWRYCCLRQESYNRHSTSPSGSRSTQTVVVLAGQQENETEQSQNNCHKTKCVHPLGEKDRPDGLYDARPEKVDARPLLDDWSGPVMRKELSDCEEKFKNQNRCPQPIRPVCRGHKR